MCTNKSPVSFKTAALLTYGFARLKVVSLTICLHMLRRLDRQSRRDDDTTTAPPPQTNTFESTRWRHKTVSYFVTYQMVRTSLWWKFITHCWDGHKDRALNKTKNSLFFLFLLSVTGMSWGWNICLPYHIIISFAHTNSQPVYDILAGMVKWQDTW